MSASSPPPTRTARTSSSPSGAARSSASSRTSPTKTTTRWTRRTRTTASGHIEAVCFDLDETLIDSAVAWRNGFVGAFEVEALPRYPELAAVPDIYEALQPFFVAELETR